MAGQNKFTLKSYTTKTMFYEKYFSLGNIKCFNKFSNHT